jgi:predicted GNAT family acetyltransferase
MQLRDVVSHTVYAVIRDGRIVSACESVRENEEAGECTVYTLPAYRGRGYGRQVTAAWGRGLLRQGKVASYSHLTGNRGSERLARRLGLDLSSSARGYS